MTQTPHGPSATPVLLVCESKAIYKTHLCSESTTNGIDHKFVLNTKVTTS